MRNIEMKLLCLVLLFHASLNLQCDKRQITAHIGGEFRIFCKYDATNYLYSRKYWCRGDSRNTCEVLVDSEGRTKQSHRTLVVDLGRRGMFVKVTDLQFGDTGAYWVGIDKVYTDIMTSVDVVITEVPVSEPRLWPLSSLEDRPTCRGRPVTVRCGCSVGTAVRYAWYLHTHHRDFLLHHSADLGLHCGAMEKDSDYYCTASNDVSSRHSDILSVQVLVPAEPSCIYVINMRGQPIYDCADRMSTTTMAQTPPLTACQATTKIPSDHRNQSRPNNITLQYLLFSRAWTGVPLWYTLLRWCLFLSLLMFLCIVIKCTKARRNRARRKRAVRFSSTLRHF